MWYKQILECDECRNFANYCDKCKKIYDENTKKIWKK